MKPIFQIALYIIVIVFVSAIYFVGFENGKYEAKRECDRTPKVCAVVPGEKVVSTTADGCTYANSFGLSTRNRRAK